MTSSPPRPRREPDLFRGFPNSYGSLGYATRLRIELEPVRRAVALRHLRFHDLAALIDTLGGIVASGSHDGEAVDYLDGVVFRRDEAYIVLGRRTDDPGPASDYTGTRIYYRSIQHDDPTPKRDLLTTHDYLWRWDTDWFWCSRAFGAQNPRYRRLWPKRWLRSSVYWKLIALDHRWSTSTTGWRRARRCRRERVVQDVEVPIERTAKFLHWFLDEVPIEPIWLCPLRLRDGSAALATPRDPLRPWPLYPLELGRTYVNVGFWSTVPIAPGAGPGATNRRIEAEVGALGGHKSLYSESFYCPRRIRPALRRRPSYAALKAGYDPRARLLDLYDKAVRNA